MVLLRTPEFGLHVNVVEGADKLRDFCVNLTEEFFVKVAPINDVMVTCLQNCIRYLNQTFQVIKFVLVNMAVAYSYVIIT